MDAGTGGLDLAYEVMRGYDALVILDVSRAGRRARDAVRDGARRGVGPGRDRGRRRDQPARDGPADRAAVRQVGRSVAGPGRRDRVRARRCRGDGLGLVAARSRTPSSERSTWSSRRSRSSGQGRSPRRRSDGALVHELSLSSAIVNTVVKHADGRRVAVVKLRVGQAAPGGPGHARVLLRVRRPRDRVRGRAARAGGDRRPAALHGVRPRVGDRDPGVPLPAVRRQRRRGRERQRVRGRVTIEVSRRSPEGDLEEAQCIAPR